MASAAGARTGAPRKERCPLPAAVQVQRWGLTWTASARLVQEVAAARWGCGSQGLGGRAGPREATPTLKPRPLEAPPLLSSALEPARGLTRLNLLALVS